VVGLPPVLGGLRDVGLVEQDARGVGVGHQDGVEHRPVGAPNVYVAREAAPRDVGQQRVAAEGVHALHRVVEVVLPLGVGLQSVCFNLSGGCGGLCEVSHTPYTHP
jgi:hypothetical protein